MKEGYKKLLGLLKGHGYNIENSGYDCDVLFIIVLTSVYFTGSDFYYIRKYAEECGVYFDGFYVEADGDGLVVKLQFSDSKSERAM